MSIISHLHSCVWYCVISFLYTNRLISRHLILIVFHFNRTIIFFAINFLLYVFRFYSIVWIFQTGFHFLCKTKITIDFFFLLNRKFSISMALLNATKWTFPFFSPLLFLFSFVPKSKLNKDRPNNHTTVRLRSIFLPFCAVVRESGLLHLETLIVFYQMFCQFNSILSPAQ